MRKIMIKGRQRALVLSLGLTITCTVPAQVIDQGFDNNVATGNGVDRSQQIGQTFTVGLEGRLTELRLDLSRSAPVYEDLWVMLTRPGDMFYYALEYIDAENIPVANSAMISVPLSTSVPMEVGEQWAIQLFSHQSGNQVVNWTHDQSAPYAGGSAYVFFGDSGAISPVPTDQCFFTVMLPQSVNETPIPLGLVPEPSTYALCFGAGLAGWAMWRRGRQNTAKER